MIVVTGAAGFIGSALVWGLNNRNIDDILVVDGLTENESWQNLVDLDFADYLDKDDFIQKLESGDLDHAITGIIHMGACSSTTERDAGFLMRNNYEYTKRLALWSAATGKRFVYASSAATYGDGSQGFGDSHEAMHNLRPLNGYGFSKYQLDRWALKRGLLGTIAGMKFFNVYGPNEYHKDDMRSVVHKAFGQIKTEGKVKLFKSHKEGYADGGQLRDFVYVKDAVEATLKIYENNQANGIFNIGTGQARSFADLVTATFDAMNIKPNIEYIDMPIHLRDKYQYYTQAETKKIQNLGIKMQSLEDGVTDYVRNYLMKENPFLSSTTCDC